MFRWKKDQDLRDQAEEYASHYDFRQIFTGDEEGLRLLAMLLTGNRGLAEQCLVIGLDDENPDNPTFHHWAHSWCKKAIIKNAIQIMAPSPRQSDKQWKDAKAPETLAGAVSCLDAFERFVFVMSLVEGYSIQECALLLGRSAQEVIIAKSRAVEQVAALLPAEESAPSPISTQLQEKIA